MLSFTLSLSPPLRSKANSSGRVLLKNMSDNFLKNWKPMFPVGKLIRACVIEKAPRVQLSLKKSDIDAIKNADGSSDNDHVQKCVLFF